MRLALGARENRSRLGLGAPLSSGGCKVRQKGLRVATTCGQGLREGEPRQLPVPSSLLGSTRSPSPPARSLDSGTAAAAPGHRNSAPEKWRLCHHRARAPPPAPQILPSGETPRIPRAIAPRPRSRRVRRETLATSGTHGALWGGSSSDRSRGSRSPAAKPSRGSPGLVTVPGADVQKPTAKLELNLFKEGKGSPGGSRREGAA